MPTAPRIPTDLSPPSGRFEGNTHFYPVRAYFEDTDFSGIVYHANYLRYMERARSDMLRVLGMDQRAAFAGGTGVYAVVDLTVRYLSPARLDDDMTVVSQVANLRGASVAMVQRIWRGDDLLIDAEVKAAFLTPAGRPTRQPKDWSAAFKTVMDAARPPHEVS